MRRWCGMVAKNTFRMKLDQAGQTMLELVLLIPFLFMFVTVLFKVMLAVQMAINNAQIARSQLFVLTKNSSDYPRLQLRYSPIMFIAAKQDRMILGVADINSMKDGVTVDPIPQVQKIGRTNATVKGSSDNGEVKKRTELRVRDTAAICTQLNAVPNVSNERWPFKTEVCRYEGMSI